MIPKWLRKLLDKFGKDDPKFFELHNRDDSYLLFASGSRSRIMGASPIDDGLPGEGDIIINDLERGDEKFFYRIVSRDSMQAVSNGHSPARQSFMLSVEEIVQA